MIKKITTKIRIKLKISYYRINFKSKIKLGKKVFFRKNFNIIIEGNGNLEVGDNCFFNNNCSINCLGKITIGKDTIFGENVKLYDHNHKYGDLDNKISTQGFNIGKINIGRNCWIASDVVILKDVVIGDNVVVGAGCIIYKSIPSNVVVKNNQNLIFFNKI